MGYPRVEARLLGICEAVRSGIHLEDLGGPRRQSRPACHTFFALCLFGLDIAAACSKFVKTDHGTRGKSYQKHEILVRVATVDE